MSYNRRIGFSHELRVTYDHFQIGEFGQAGPSHAPEGSFTGRNVYPYVSGRIGPRPGLKVSAIVPSSGVAISNLWRLVSDGSSNTADVLWVAADGSVVKAVESTGTKTTLTGSITAPIKAPQIAHLGLGKYMLANFTDKCYTIDVAANTVTAISGSPGGSCIAAVNDRVFVGNDGGSGFARVFYTDPAVYTAFPPANFFDVGARPGVAALVGQRDHLAIAMEDGSWWVYRGVGSAASLRKVTAADWPNWVFNPHALANMADDVIVEMTPLGDWPAIFDGAALVHNYLPGPGGNGTFYSNVDDIRVLPGRRPGEAIMLLPDGTNGARLYVKKGSAWTIHTLPTNISSVACAIGSGRFLLCKKTAPAAFYTFDEKESMGFTNDTYSRPGDLTDTPVDAQFHMPEWWDQPGNEVQVRQVIVDFVKFNTGASGDNNITLDLISFGQFNNDGTESPVAQSWSEAVSSAAGSVGLGTRARHVFNIGEQGFGAGFQVGLTSLKGVSIRNITVVLSSQPRLPRE